MQNWKNHIFGLKDVLIFSLASLLVGIVLGFLIAPIKKGMTIGCRNYITGDDKDRDFHEDLEMELNELR